MKKSSIIFYWLLILIPALIMSLSAFNLLSHEQERLNNMAVASAHDRARTIGETLQVTVEAVEDELTDALHGIAQESLEEILLAWEENNPLVRNVFVWDEGTGLRYPQKGIASTSEERRFILRYDGLFSGRIPWAAKRGGDTDEKKSRGLFQDVSKLKASREALVNIAKGREVSSYDSNVNAEKEITKTGNWIPWFAENRLYILGWVKNSVNGPVYGVELELMTLLSRLITNFPESPAEGFAYALMDDEGQMLHQTGNTQIHPGSTPDIALSLAPHLPHWELAVYISNKNLLVRSGKGFAIIAGLLLVIFIAAIILGGSLLTWQAHRNMIDASQKTSFVSNVSHELKTPLTSIRMYAELLSDGRVKDPDKKNKYLQVIVAESQRLTRLVNNVLDFSRLEQGGKKYCPEEIDLTVYLNDLIESHRLRIKEAGLELGTSYPEEKIVVHTDRDAIEQVLVNLIDNAIKYAGTGKKLNISLEANNRNCEIRVEDRGPGVPEAHQDRIFEKFHRVDDSLTSKQQGSGLGLSIALRILKGLGGDLRYEPREGGGCSFIIQLPLNFKGK
jgi:signal transduction histidine kinase